VSGAGNNMYKNIFQKICCKLTDHKFRKGIMYSEGIEPPEFHYQCKICGYRFWNYQPFDTSRWDD
jgi:hypothetical protein